MDFAFFAIAFNIKKMCRKLSKRGIEGLKRILTDFIHTIFTLLYLYRNASKKYKNHYLKRGNKNIIEKNKKRMCLF